MTSLKIKPPIIAGIYYHIFNRGINRQAVFFTEDNYFYFLSLIRKYCINHMHILAYSLLPNHFHLIVKIKDELNIPKQESGAVYTQTIPPRTLIDIAGARLHRVPFKTQFDKYHTIKSCGSEVIYFFTARTCLFSPYHEPKQTKLSFIEPCARKCPGLL